MSLLRENCIIRWLREGPIFYCFVLLRSSLATQNLHCLVLCRPTVVIEPCSGNLRPVKNKRKALPLSVKLSQCHVCHLQPEHLMLRLFNPCCYCRSLCGLLRFLKRKQSHSFSTLMLSRGCLGLGLPQVQGWSYSHAFSYVSLSLVLAWTALQTTIVWMTSQQ